MIVKFVQRKLNVNDRTSTANTKTLIEYIRNPETLDGSEKCCATFAINAIGGKDEILDECLSVASQIPRNGTAFDHYIISWPEIETPSYKECVYVAKTYVANCHANGLGFCGIHVNTENMHLHLALQHFTNDFQNSLKTDNANTLYRLHAINAMLEKKFHFQPETNPLVLAERLDEKTYWFSLNTAKRSVGLLRPKYSHLLPILSDFPTNANTFPNTLERKGNFCYFKNEELPVLYMNDNNAVVLQWWRPEIVSLVQENRYTVHNTVRSKNFAISQKIIPLEEIPTPTFGKRKKKLEEDYDWALSLTSGFVHKSKKEEEACRFLLEIGYDSHELLEFMFKQSMLERDMLFRFRIAKMIENANRRVNVFRQMIQRNKRNLVVSERKNNFAIQMLEDQKKKWLETKIKCEKNRVQEKTFVKMENIRKFEVQNYGPTPM